MGSHRRHVPLCVLCERLQGRRFEPRRADAEPAAFPAGYEPESIDAYEIGAKNTLLDGRLQANLTAWYYNYGNYQISSIIANTSVNTNINAFLGGLEGEFLWAPTDRWQFNFNADWTQSRSATRADRHAQSRRRRSTTRWS